MNQRNEFLVKASALTVLMMLGLFSSCINKSGQNPGETQSYPISYTTMTPTGDYPYPLSPRDILIDPTKILEYPLPPTPISVTPYPKCEEDYQNELAFFGAPKTPPGWWYPQNPTLTYGEVGNAAPDEIVKLLLEKHFDQFKTPEATDWQLEDYSIDDISIDNRIQCRGPNQIENVWGNLKYSVKPAIGVDNSNWLAGGARILSDGWIANTTHFVLIRTINDFELQLTGNG